MVLPNAARAHVAKEKLLAYLLSPTHHRGKSKAAFFIRYGFTAANWTELAASLVLHATENEVIQTGASRYGTRYAIDGLLHAPSGAVLNVRSVWFITAGEEIPRFTTAHPLKRISR